MWQGAMMDESAAKADLHRYLQDARSSMLWKLEGLSEYDMRRPLVPTGTNLLGLVKHVALVEAGYLGDTFGRPVEGWVPQFESSDVPNADMWAAADESSEQITGFYRRVSEHCDETFWSLPLEAKGRVPWWPEERAEATLHHLVVRVIGETNRHAGHADIVRELIDGEIGWLQGNDNLPSTDPEWWREYRESVEQVAQGFR